MTSSFEQNYKEKTLNNYNAGYIRQNYNIVGKSSNKYTSNNPNLISRVQCQLVRAIHDEIKLPKYIVMVMDDDIVDIFRDTPELVTDTSMGKIINVMMNDIRKLIQMQKEYLPTKAKRMSYPHIIWIEAPIHDNFRNNYERTVFNRNLNSVVKLFDDISILKLKKIWEPTNSRLFIEENNRFTSEGLANYWAAVDYTMKFMDTLLIDKLTSRSTKRWKSSKSAMRKSSNFTRSESRPPKDQKYYWQNPKYNRGGRRHFYDDEEYTQERRTLPAPPNY